MNMIKETSMKNTLHIPHSFCGLGMCSTSLYSSSDQRSFHLKHIKNQTHFGYFHKEFHSINITCDEQLPTNDVILT